MKHLSLVLAVSVCSIVLFTACGDKRLKGYEKTDTGFYYKYVTQNPEGTQPQIGDYVFLTVSYSSTNDSLPPFENQEMAFFLPKPAFKGDIIEAYAMLKEGEEIDFIFIADSFFKGEKPDFISPEDLIYVKVKMNKMKTLEDFEQEEEEAIAGYIKTNNITVEPTASGLYFMETLKGKGAKVESGKRISVHYTGKFLDGTVFDSSIRGGQPLSFILGVDGMIPGFVEGVLLMNQGGKASLLLPSEIAYGMADNPRSPIPPFSPLLFDVEIISVE